MSQSKEVQYAVGKGKCPCTVNKKLWKAENSGDEIQWGFQVCTYLRRQKSGEKNPGFTLEHDAFLQLYEIIKLIDLADNYF